MLMKGLEFMAFVGLIGLIFTHADGVAKVVTGGAQVYAKTVKGLEAF